MQAKELSFRFHGDDHYELMFQKELQEARTQGVDPADLGVPDIRDEGTREVGFLSHCRWSHDGLLFIVIDGFYICLLYTSPSPRDEESSRMPSSA